jgi:hypothetical protein
MWYIVLVGCLVAGLIGYFIGIVTMIEDTFHYEDKKEEGEK